MATSFSYTPPKTTQTATPFDVNAQAPQLGTLPKPQTALAQTTDSTMKDYSNAGSNFVDAEQQGVQNYMGKPGIKQLLGPTEAALGGTASAISTVLSPISNAIKSASDSFAKNAKDPLNPKQPLTSNPVVSKLLDFFGNASGGLDKWANAHPEAAQNLNNALTVGMTALGGGENGLDKPIGTVRGILEAPGKISENMINGSDALKTRLTPSGPSLSNLAETTSGVADKGARISSLEQTGALDKNGNPIGGTKQTFMGGIKTEPTGMDLARAKDVQGIVNPKASPVDNLTNLNKEITRISEKEVTPRLEKAGATTPISEKAPGWNTTVQRLTDLEKPDIIKADATLDKTYDLVRQRMIDQIQKQPPTVKGLWEARKAFDSVVKDQFGDVAFNSEKNTAIKRAISDMRRTVNDIIGERVPEYKPFMSKLSNLYDARYNIAEQYQGLVDKGGIKAFTTLNPKKAALLKWGVGALGYETAKHTVAPFLPGI